MFSNPFLASFTTLPCSRKCSYLSWLSLVVFWGVRSLFGFVLVGAFVNAYSGAGCPPCPFLRSSVFLGGDFAPFWFFLVLPVKAPLRKMRHLLQLRHSGGIVGIPPVFFRRAMFYLFLMFVFSSSGRFADGHFQGLQ